MSHEWILQPQLSRKEALERSRALSLSPVMVQLLHNRGVSPARTESFLRPRWTEVIDPFRMKGMTTASSRLVEAIVRKERVLVYGDYDADGITATSVLLLFLRQAGLQGYYYIPDRQAEGYGLNRTAVDKAIARDIDLLVTCDCGISCLDEIFYARSRGLEVLVTDHHRVDEVLPSWLTVLNPHQPGCDYPCPDLAAVGVALKLCQAIAGRLQMDEGSLKHLLDLVAIGTIADMVALRGENRVLVKLGLKELRGSRNPGIRALARVCGLTLEDVSERDIAYGIAPRLNACGRISLAEKGVRLFLAEQEKTALSLARALDRENRRRQSLKRRMCREADALIPTSPGKVIVVSRDDWHPGLLGLVASYLQEKYERPAVALSTNRAIARGSARTIRAFPIFEALTKVQDLLLEFGGHRMAAGMTLATENIPLLEARLNELADTALTPNDLKPRLMVDTRVDIDALGGSFMEEMELLSPFGSGNPFPLLQMRGVLCTSPLPGAQGNPLLRSRDGKVEIPIVGQFSTPTLRVVTGGAEIELVGTPCRSDMISALVALIVYDVRGDINGRTGTYDSHDSGFS